MLDGLTDEQFVRMTVAFVHKVKDIAPRSAWVDEDEWLANIVGTVIADTWLVLCRGMSIENWE